MSTPGTPTSDVLLSLLEQVPDIVWRYRLVPGPRFEYVSPSVFALTGYTPAEHYADPYLGRRIAHPDDAPRLAAFLAAPAATTTVRLRWLHKSGMVFATEQRISVVRGAAGDVEALQGVGRPLTDGGHRHELRAGDLVLDLAMHRVLVGDRVVDLTPAEHRILALLATTDGPVEPEAIVTRLWGTDHPGGARTVQVHVSNLRRKIEDAPSRPRRLLTRRGQGYVLAR